MITSISTDIDTSIDTETGKSAPADLSTDRVHDIFSSIANKYERFNALSSFGAYRRWLSKMMDVADIEEGDDVLDIAGGTGDVAFAVCRMKHPGHVQLTDLVPQMLDVARHHIEGGAACGVDVDIDVVDAQDIPYDDNSFDAITVAYGLRNMPKRELALLEMHRVLKPGGSLTCLDFSTPTNAVWRTLYNFYLRYMIPFWGRLVTGDAAGFVYLAKSIQAFPDQKGVGKMMEDAGFKDVDWVDCTGGIACIHTAVK